MSAESKELSTLWDKACTGDHKAFSAIHKKLHSKMYSSAKRMIKDEELTEDILQNTFIKLWLRKEAIGNVDNVAGYFFMATRSMCLSHIRTSEAMQVKFEPIEVSKFREPIQTSIEDTITEREATLRRKKIVEAALKQLPRRQREIMQLRFYESLNSKDIVKLTGLKYQSVANQMYRAVQTLRDLHVLKNRLSAAG